MSAEANEKANKKCQTLTTRGMERREFLKLTRDISLVALTAGITAPIQTKYAAVDLDWADYHVTELHQNFNQGSASYVMKEAQRCYNMLKQTQFSAKAVRASEIQMRFGMLLAKAQDSALPWYERTIPTIGTYNCIENEVLSKLPLRQYSSYHAHLLARRAPLYREIGDLRKSLEQFTTALENCQHKVEEIDLLVEIYYSRAHVWAVLGDERNWQSDLAQARKYAQQANPTRSKQLFSLITYTEGEGYKRLAYNKHLDLSEDCRVHYATQGLECFGKSHMEESRWGGHVILNNVAAAQCMILIDPNEAIRQAEHLRVEAERIYPSIVQKIDRTIAFAQKRLQNTLYL